MIARTNSRQTFEAALIAAVCVAIMAGVAVVAVTNAVIEAALVLVCGVVMVVWRVWGSKRSLPFASVITRERGRSLYHLLSLDIFLLFLYQLGFNLLSDSIRTALAVVLGVFTLGITLIATALTRPSIRVGGAWAAIGLLILTDILALLLNVHGSDASAWFRKFFPLIFAAAILRRPDLVSAKVTAFCASATAIIGSGVAVLGGFAYHSDVLRLTPFTGGTDGDHSSSYVLVCCLIIVTECAINGVCSRRRAIFVGVVSLIALVGLSVGTALVMLFAYLGYRFWNRVRAFGLRAAVVLLILIVALVLGVYRNEQRSSGPYAAHTTGADLFASGRFATWDQRLGFIDERTVGPLVLGLGTGSDLYLSPVWSDSPKDSHEDFLTVILENGFLGYLALMLALGALLLAPGRAFRAAAAGFLISSLISNALLARPMIFVLFWLAGAIVSQPSVDPAASSVALARPSARANGRPSKTRSSVSAATRRPTARLSAGANS